jgi:DNA-binding GntR family transcriptional regulator
MTAIDRQHAAPTVSVAIYEQLRTLIVRGRLLPGMRLTEGDVATQLQASRTPAREALRRLRQEGLLVPIGPENGGKTRVAVAPMTREEAKELYVAAGALEGIAAREVATRPAAERKALAARLTRAEDTFEREAKKRSPDWDRLFELHDAFHRTFVDSLAGPRLHVLLDGLRSHLDRYEYMYGPLLGPGYEATFAEHAAIIHAIAEDSADVVERAVRANWFRGAERLGEVVESAGEAGFLRQQGGLVGLKP